MDDLRICRSVGKEECHPGYIAGGMCCLGCRWCGAGCFPWGLISDVLGGVAGGCRARVSLEKKGAKATRQEKTTDTFPC